jgi:SNF2 family DNA or RNA helicase
VVFQQYNISLRPYQKQALFFMLQRENDGMTREQLDDQLQILNELMDQQQNDKKYLSSSYRSDQLLLTTGSNDVICDCGPVLVTEKGQQKSRTVCGEINPIGHPLWQRRYLATSDMNHSITVFVNELLGVVTHVAPQAPKHCSGGILADAMGLGKTVMLLALMLKSKEQRSQILPVDGQNVSSSTATLVVAKLSLLPQWEAELKTKTNLTYKIYYGATSGKPTNISDFLSNVVR